MGNVRIAIRDSTDAHSIGFFDNVAGIEYKSANLHRFLAGSASILTLKYSSKDIDTIRSGCKLAFRYKNRDYWLNIMDFSKKGYEVEIKAYSAGLELNNEKRGTHKADRAMSFAEYLAYYDPEHSLELGVNEVADKRIKLEWTGTDTILSRLFSIANSFGAELEFTVELNQDYSLKRQILNVYKTGNLGSNRKGKPVRVGKELKVINYSDNIKNLRTAIRATGKDGLTIDGLNKKIYDDNNRLLYYSSGMTVYAPQSRDRFPSVGKKSNDNWIVEDLGETQYETKEALWAYMYGEIQKKSVPEITYDVEGAIDSDIGDTQTLIDDKHFEPGLYVQARVSELEEDILEEKVTKSTFINFERKYSQVASELIKQVEQLANDAAPYIIRLETNNGFNFKNGKGSSTVTASLEKYGKIVGASWQWIINNSVVSDKQSATINASQVVGTLNVVAVASVNGNEVAREYITFTNSDDGVGIKSIKRYYTTNDQSEGVTTGGQNWSTKPATVTADNKYMWSYDVITYTNDTSLVTEPAVIGARGDDGLDADATGITEALDKAKQELSALSANIEKVRDDSLAAVEEAKQQLATVANDLSAAKQDLQTQASQLQAQASAQSELTKRVSSVEETANGTKTTVSELSKTVDSNTKNITSVTARTKTVEDDLTSTKTTLSQVQTTADSVSSKTATLETGLSGLKADLAATTTTANTTKTNLASYQASNDKAVANLQSNLQTANGNISSLQTKVEAVPGQITSAVSAVEDKIPTNLDSLNLMTGTRDWSTKTNAWHMGINWSTESEEYQGLKVHSTQKGWNGSHQNIFVKNGDVVTFSFFARATNTLSKIKVSSRWSDSSVYQAPLAGVKESDEQITITSEWKRYSKTVHIISDGSLQFRTEYDGSTIPGGNTFYVAGLKVAKSALDTGYSENPTDVASDITKMNTTLTQTATGLEQLSTQVTSQGNTITSHTNSINSLTTGLSAKVSQTDFNTLSGRVTTAENNITAKANELSSKISSVEGKIPTNVSTRNLILKSNDLANPHKQSGANTTVTSTDDYFVIKSTGYTANAWGGMSWNMSISEVKAGEEFSILMPVYIDSSVNLDNGWNFNLKNHPSNSTAYNYSIPVTKKDEWFNVAITFKTTKDVVFDTYPFYVYLVKNGLVRIKPPILVRGSLIPSDYQPAPEDYDSALATAQSEIKQTTDSIKASVSSVQTTASNAQATANTAVSKADAAQSSVNALNETTVKTVSLNLDNNGFVTKVGKTVNGNTFATMIAQNESDVQIIAKKMKVSGDMIVNGAITAEKLNVSNLSAVNSNLGAIKGGSLLLQENKAASSSVDSWGTFNRPAHKQGLYMDNHGLASSGAIQRKNGGETTPTDMPLAVLQSGELRFLVVDYNDNLENVLHYGLSDPDFGAIRFEIDSELKRRLTMTSSGYLNFQATNYTNWQSTGVSGCEYMIQGRLVLVNYDVTFNSAGTHSIGSIPQEFTKKSLMMTAKGWSVTPRDKNIQLNPDGSLHILDAEKNVNYRGTLVFSY